LKTEWADITKRAKVIQEKTGLATGAWAKSLQSENARQTHCLSI
jgi:spermidine synthase